MLRQVESPVVCRIWICRNEKHVWTGRNYSALCADGMDDKCASRTKECGRYFCGYIMDFLFPTIWRKNVEEVRVYGVVIKWGRRDDSEVDCACGIP